MSKTEYLIPEVHQPRDLDISPVTPDFARQERDIREVFDWDDIIRRADERHSFWDGQILYLVAFRSQRKPEADVEMLNTYDAAAHLDAANSEGYITYFKGEADNEGYNLSFCLWQSAKDARAATSKSSHQQAARLAGSMYADYKLERYAVCTRTNGPTTLTQL